MKRIISGIIVILLLMTMLTLAFNIKPTKATRKTIIVPDDFPTIQAAINNASAGDTIFVKNGTYHEHITLSKTLALIGEDRKAIVDGNGTGNIFTVSNGAINASIAGFIIQNASCGIYIDASFITVGLWNVTIADNTIQNCTKGIGALATC
jgi:nitrous oxidase accessory protein NosD